MRQWYNDLLVRPAFWASLCRPWVLLAEPDAVLCPRPSTQLQSFLTSGARYLGAPWSGRADLIDVCDKLNVPWHMARPAASDAATVPPSSSPLPSPSPVFLTLPFA